MHPFPIPYPDDITQDIKGGFITYTADVLDQVNLATVNFAANNTDPKAAILPTYNYLLGQVIPFCSIFFGIQF